MERKQTCTFQCRCCFRAPKSTQAHRAQGSLRSTFCRERAINTRPRSWRGVSRGTLELVLHWCPLPSTQTCSFQALFSNNHTTKTKVRQHASLLIPICGRQEGHPLLAHHLSTFMTPLWAQDGTSMGSLPQPPTSQQQHVWRASSTAEAQRRPSHTTYPTQKQTICTPTISFCRDIQLQDPRRPFSPFSWTPRSRNSPTKESIPLAVEAAAAWWEPPGNLGGFVSCRTSLGPPLADGLSHFLLR